MSNRSGWLITCEHASAAVPDSLKAVFTCHPSILASHRGWDPGALELASALAAGIKAPFYQGNWTRLLVDLNRSEENPEIWSEFSRALADHCREDLLQNEYRPFRQRCRETVEEQIRQFGQCHHISVHSFTPVFQGIQRNFEFGILFDPARSGESAWAEDLHHALAASFPQWTIVFNQPYLGTDDGHAPALRRSFSGDQYLGLELELNQSLLTDQPDQWRALVRLLPEIVQKPHR